MVAINDNELTVNGQKIPVLGVKDPADLPWKQMNVDVAIDPARTGTGNPDG